MLYGLVQAIAKRMASIKIIKNTINKGSIGGIAGALFSFFGYRDLGVELIFPLLIFCLTVQFHIGPDSFHSCFRN